MAPGGAPANVAVALRRLGVPSGFIGKVGDDPFGRFLRGVLEEEKLDLDLLSSTRESLTRLACITNDANEQQRFVFYGNPGADVLLSPRDIRASYLRKARIFHFGSISLIREPSRSATLKALALARKFGLTVSFDPNLRPALWPSLRRARSEILRALPACDVLKLNEFEWEFLFPGRRFEEFFSLAPARKIRLLAVTLGRGGSFVATPAGAARVRGLPVRVADTTGAGDGFVAGVLYSLAQQDKGIPLTQSLLAQMATFANTVGALTCTKPGAIPAFPSLKEVRRRMQRSRHTR